MAILVCGGAGYVGSHTAHALRDAGYDCVILDNLSKGHREAVEGFDLIQGDLWDTELLNRIFEQYKIDGVIHFAAFSLVGESVTKPLDYYENNVGATHNLLKAMLAHGVNKIVFSSTAATYGEPERIPIKETDRTFPTNPYGETKLAIEKMFKWSDAAYGLKYVCLRYFNAAGAQPDGEIGEDHSPETHLIPLVLQTALGKRDCIKIFGDDYDTKDGTCVRDYVHVCDLASAHILALQRLINGGESGIFNLGSSTGFSNLEVIETARRVTGINFKSEMAPRRPGDPAVLVASSDAARSELGWKPTRSDIETIIADAWNWHIGHPDGYRK